MIDTKLKLFFEQQTLIHLKCDSGRFYNGIIKELDLEKELLLFEDRKLGIIPILFEEIEFIEPYAEEGK